MRLLTRGFGGTAAGDAPLRLYASRSGGPSSVVGCCEKNYHKVCSNYRSWAIVDGAAATAAEETSAVECVEEPESNGDIW